MSELQNLSTEELEALLAKKKAEEVVPEPESEPTIETESTEDLVEEELLVMPTMIIPEPEVAESIDIIPEIALPEIEEVIKPENVYNPAKALELLKQAKAAFEVFATTMGFSSESIRINWDKGFNPLREAIRYLIP